MADDEALTSVEIGTVRLLEVDASPPDGVGTEYVGREAEDDVKPSADDEALRSVETGTVELPDVEASPLDKVGT